DLILRAERLECGVYGAFTDVLHINANQYRLKYAFDWELFLGCSDRNETGVENGSVLFTLEDDNVLNINFPNYGSRDTSDEL
ncbi:hypothetical protein AB6C88_23820, partial [Vibrio splendidus]